MYLISKSVLHLCDFYAFDVDDYVTYYNMLDITSSNETEGIIILSEQSADESACYVE